MSFIVGTRFREFAKYNTDCLPENVGYDSLALRLSGGFRVETPEGIDIIRTDNKQALNHVYTLKDSDTYTLAPNETVNIKVLEHITVPDSMIGVFEVVSELALLGLSHTANMYYSPKWQGQITLQVRNNLRYTPIRLIRGSVIGTLRFLECHE